jgi:hypothetical protein
MGMLTKAGAVLDQYRERHHAVARLIAIGATHDHIRRQTGISFKRISCLIADPTFKELVALYRKDVEKIWNRNIDQYLDLGMSNMIQTEAMIQDQLEEADEEGKSIPLLTLNRISQDRADRFGYPKTSQVEHKHDFAALLDRAIDRSGKAKEVKVIEQIAVEVVEDTLTRSLPSVQSSATSEARTVPSRRASSPRPSIADVLSVRRRKVA